MSLYLGALLFYSVFLMALGLFISRRVKNSSDFLVAGRSLGPGRLFATFLAANIGAGSTVGATGLGYRFGMSAWWWVGSASIGTFVLSQFLGPKLWRVAKEHHLATLQDYLEFSLQQDRQGNHRGIVLVRVVGDSRRLNSLPSRGSLTRWQESPSGAAA